MATVTKIIKKQPQFVKRVYYTIVPFRYRYGREFRITYNFLKKTSDWPLEQLLEYQNIQLKHLIHICYHTVPYYRKMFESLKLFPNDINNVDDLKLLPILTKDDINSCPDDFISFLSHKSKLCKFKTSGSTGKKLIFYGSDDVYKREAAFVLRAFHAHGAQMYSRPSIWLRRYVPPDNGKTLWNYDYELKRLYMSAYHINANTAINYFAKINDTGYKTLVGYPSSIFILACFAEDLNLIKINLIF